MLEESPASASVTRGFSGLRCEPAGETFTLPIWPSKRNAAPSRRRPRKNRRTITTRTKSCADLIVAPEQEGIATIQERLDNLEKRTADVSVVVAEAIQMRREKGDDLALAAALAPTIQETLRESVRRDPHVLADALFPVMGPAIRKSIAETLRGMLESFNEALEHSLSWRGIKWRIEGFRTGKPFAEIVLMHSLLYRVEQVFLIHRETGLVLNHVVAPSAPAQDAAMVAGLLSAIQQFARDSFQPGQTENLGNMTFDELQIRVVSGPNAVIAAAIRGHAPEAYNLAMNETLEEIQRHYSSALAHFTGDPGPFRAAEPQIARLLETQYREKPPETRRPRAAIIAGAIAAVLLLGWAGYSTYLLDRMVAILIGDAQTAGNRRGFLYERWPHVSYSRIPRSTLRRSQEINLSGRPRSRFCGPATRTLLFAR